MHSLRGPSVGPVLRFAAELSHFPAAVQCFATLLRQAFPGQVFSSLAVFDNVAAAMHKDSRNAPYPNLLFALTRFRGGEVWCESSTGTVFRSVRGLDRPSILLPVADAPQTLMAHEVFHQTEPWKGDRLLLVGFTVQRTLELSLAQLQLLQSLGFVMPPSHLKRGGHDDDDKPRTSSGCPACFAHRGFAMTMMTSLAPLRLPSMLAHLYLMPLLLAPLLKPPLHRPRSS